MARIHSLGYLVVETTDLDRWRELAVDVLGMLPGKGPDEGSLYLRIDDRPYRLVIHPGQTERLVTVGWECRDRETFREVVAQLEASGAPVKAGSAEEAELRRVQEFVTTADPAGTQIEVFHGAALVHDKPAMTHGATFVTGAQGMGHVVLPSANAEESYDFYTKVLGFKSRGAFKMGPQYLRFLSCNERHHALALAPWPQDNGIIHFMMEVESRASLGFARDPRFNRKFPHSATRGRHTKHNKVSFYVGTPGGFDIELGWDGKRISEDGYTAEDITADSIWGHRWAWQK